jgi:hypothetical protein
MRQKRAKSLRRIAFGDKAPTTRRYGKYKVKGSFVEIGPRGLYRYMKKCYLRFRRYGIDVIHGLYLDAKVAQGEGRIRDAEAR